MPMTFGLSQTEFPSDPALKAFALSALSTDDARRLVHVVGQILAALNQGDSRMITEVKKNPGAVLAAAIETGPVLLADGKRKGAAEAMILPAEDVQLLVRFISEMSVPRYVTGADLYERFAHAGEPSAISIAPPQEDEYVSPTLDVVLGRVAATE